VVFFDLASFAQEANKLNQPATAAEGAKAVVGQPQQDAGPAGPQKGGGPREFRREEADALRLVLLVVIGVPMSLGLLLLVLTLSPAITERVAGHIKDSRFRCFLLGIPVVAVLALLTALGKSHAAVVTFPVLAVFLVWGGVGLAEDVGRRLMGFAGKDCSRPVRILVGWPALALAMLPPVVCWIFVGIPAGCIACGAFLQALFQKKAASPAPAA
jgi:hypothetical protein